MGNIIALFDRAAKATEITVKPEVTKYTIEQLKGYDYRGMFQEAVKQQKGARAAVIAVLLAERFRTIDLAHGALIALKLKQDREAAEYLSKKFQEVLATGALYGTLADLPEYVRGYVWGYYPVLTAYARATVTPSVKF
jgi:hypothetical protein